MMNTKQSILAAAFSLLFIAAPGAANAQSVDSCMTSKGEDAVQICQSLLKSGNRSAEIYYQLASQLYQLGRTSEAMTILNNGLSRHKANTLLTTLRNTLEFDSEEQAALRASAKKNEAVMNRGQLKITCLTKISRAALEACEGYLAQTNVDGDRIRARAQIIATELTPSPTTQIATAPTIPVEPAPTIVPEVSAPPAVVEPAPLNEAQIALRELIRNIQSDLSSLGFSVGIPDGIAGPRTRTAVREFYERTQQIQSDRLDDQTLIDVQAAVADLNTSERFLKQSRLAASNQQAEQAISLLALAERSSPLFKAPVGYRQNLELQLGRQAPSGQTTIASSGSQNTPTTVAQAPQPANTQSTQQTGTNADVVQTQQIPDLISQIESLTATLTLRRANSRRHNQAMRDVVDNLFQ